MWTYRIFFRNKKKKEKKKEIEDLLKEFDICINDEIGQLSNEEKKKLSFIMAFMGNNKIILLDEPTSGVTRGTRNIIWNFLKKTKKIKLLF